jgi:hypothetical protein
MLENELHGCTGFQQDYKLVKAGQLTTQSDAVHEEHVYGGLVAYERLKKVVLYAGGAVTFWGQCDRSFGLPALAEAASQPRRNESLRLKGVEASLRDLVRVHAVICVEKFWTQLGERREIYSLVRVLDLSCVQYVIEDRREPS